MKSFWRGFLAMVVAACAAAQEPVEAVAPADPVDEARAQVDAARTAWEDEVRRAREELLKAVDAALQGVEKNRRLSDIQRLKAKDDLRSDRNALINGGRVPISAEVAEAAVSAFVRVEWKAREQFRASVRGAAARLRKAADESADALLRELESVAPHFPSPRVFAKRMADLVRTVDCWIIPGRDHPVSVGVRLRLDSIVAAAAANRVSVADLHQQVRELLDQVRASGPFHNPGAKLHKLMHQVADALAATFEEPRRAS